MDAFQWIIEPIKVICLRIKVPWEKMGFLKKFFDGEAVNDDEEAGEISKETGEDEGHEHEV